MTVHTRVAIVGGGIYGCGLLMQLVEKGWTDVTLLEKSELTAGSTWHAAGFCTHYSFSPTHLFMRQFSTDLYRQLDSDVGTPTGYHRCRGLRVTHDPDRMDEFRHGLSVGRQMGIDFDIVGPSEIEEIFPLMNTKGLLGALYEPTDGYVDPSQTTHAMAKRARDGGATILRNSPVTSIEQTAGGEWCLRTSQRDIIAEHVVLAPGFWANEIGRMIGLDLPITPMLHQYFVTDDHPDVATCEPDSIPLVRHHDYQWYTRRERDGLILGAYEENPQTWSINGVPENFGMELFDPELDRVAHLMADAMERMPVLNEAGIKTTVHGPVSYSADGQPLIGPAPGLRNAWLSCGSGFGIGEGAGAGKLLAEWMVEGQPPMHMGVFDPRRFGDFSRGDYRVEKAIEVFSMQFATHYVMEERPAGRPTKKTPLYDRLKKNGARFGCVYGWERANWFASGDEQQTMSFHRTEWFAAVAREVNSVTTHAGVIDLSGFSKLLVSGVDSKRFLDRLSANRLPSKSGEIRLCHFLNDMGTVECEFTITRVSEESYYLVFAAAAEQHHRDWLDQHLSAEYDVRMDCVTSKRGVIGLSGPASAAILSTLTDADLTPSGFPWLTAQNIAVAGKTVLAMNMSYTGENGWELHHDINDQLAIYDALKSMTSVDPPVDFGFYALNSMRLEKGYKAWGVELTVENNAWELGLDRFISLKDRDFIGRRQLMNLRESGAGPIFHLCEVDTESSDIIGGEAVFADGDCVGVAISGAFGHRIQKSLAFLLINDMDSIKHRDLTVEVLGQHCRARLADNPAYTAG
ncbi:MAG: FAD-dependent oxidoreductase [Pseudomonadota bacterium]